MYSQVILVPFLCALVAAAPAPVPNLIARSAPTLAPRQDNGTSEFKVDAGNTQALATGSTQNGLSGACASMTVIFARGTTEVGNVGTLTGPPFFAALSAAMGSTAKTLAVQGVNYPADIPGFLVGGDKQGSKTMAALVTQAMTQCPQTKVVMSGYSQGGQLVHNAAKLLPAATMAKVNSVVIFGDPDKGQPLPGISAANVKTICHQGDAICAGQALILAPHLTYSVDAGTAAAFVVGKSGLGIQN